MAVTTMGGPPTLFFGFFWLIFILIAVSIIVIIGKGIATWAANNASPVESRSCTVVGKRTRVSGGAGDTSASTSYYVTFEFEDRRRLELRVGANQYGYLIEGDKGTLTYQGTRYKHFDRTS